MSALELPLSRFRLLMTRQADTRSVCTLPGDDALKHSRT